MHISACSHLECLVWCRTRTFRVLKIQLQVLFLQPQQSTIHYLPALEINRLRETTQSTQPDLGDLWWHQKLNRPIIRHIRPKQQDKVVFPFRDHTATQALTRTANINSTARSGGEVLDCH